MTDLTDTIKRMAKLAKLAFPQKDLARYTEKAKAVLAYVEKLNELDTEGVNPTSHAVEIEKAKQPLRGDEVARWKDPDEIIKQATAVEGEFVQVPKVIE